MYTYEAVSIYPASALVKSQPEVKEAARKRLVHITEHGRAAFVFASEEVFQREVDEAVAEKLEAIEMRAAIAQGRADFEAGRYVLGAQAAREELARQRAAS